MSLSDVADWLREALAPTRWEVGGHVARRRSGFGDPNADTEYVCVDCGASAPTREELAEEEHWEEADR